MNGRLFIDTNIAIYLLGGHEHITELLDGQIINISFVTELELLSKPDLQSDEQKHIVSFLADCTIFDILPALKETIVDIRQRYRLRLPDAIIAATAYQLGLPLMTADRAFRKIEELTVIAVEI